MFFFSSRRRHTRLQGDWSSDVCSSDLKFRRLEVSLVSHQPPEFQAGLDDRSGQLNGRLPGRYTRSEERRVGKSVDLGGRRIIKKKKEADPCQSDHEISVQC